MSAAPLRHSEIRGSQHAPAGRPRTSARRPDSLASGTQPFTADLLLLRELACRCRMAAGGRALAAACASHHGDSDASENAEAYALQQVGELLDRLADDPKLLEIADHRAAGGSVRCIAPMVVVGLEQHQPAPPASNRGLVALFRRLTSLRGAA